MYLILDSVIPSNGSYSPESNVPLLKVLKCLFDNKSNLSDLFYVAHMGDAHERKIIRFVLQAEESRKQPYSILILTLGTVGMFPT